MGRDTDKTLLIILQLRAKQAEYQCNDGLALSVVTPGMDVIRREDPQYSPDLSPCDYDLIRKVDEPLRCRRFGTRNDCANAV
ncbi:hypothetical protein C0J52_06364 [Blattella germanica]|nr:hypothetical protein C0J52_06364 [Blattella germanica]